MSRSPSSYAFWVREMVQAAHARPSSNQLFDSSIEEPLDMLRQLALSLDFSATGQYRSVFPSGNPLMLRALARRYHLPQERILATAGASSGVHLVCAALLSPGDRVLVERPYFDVLPDLARSVGAQVDHLDRDPDTGGIDPQRLDAAITPQTRLVMLTNPNNPTGFVLDRAARVALAKVAVRRRVPVLFDEVYAGFSDEPPPQTLAAHDSEWFVSVGSLSKLYGLYALKCGWIVTGAATHARILDSYRRLEMGVSRLTHALGARVLEAPAAFEDHWRGVLAASRPLVGERLQGLEREGLLQARLPAHGCLCFPRLPDGWCDRDFSAFAWEAHGLAIAPGDLFGRPGHLRIGFGRNAEHVREGLDRFEDALRGYRRRHPA